MAQHRTLISRQVISATQVAEIINRKALRWGFTPAVIRELTAKHMILVDTDRDLPRGGFVREISDLPETTRQRAYYDDEGHLVISSTYVNDDGFECDLVAMRVASLAAIPLTATIPSGRDAFRWHCGEIYVHDVYGAQVSLADLYVPMRDWEADLLAPGWC